MRKFLLASVATLGTGGLMGAALAQAPGGAPTQGQQAWPLVNPTSYVNNNNNYQAPALPGALANPTPGTIVIHVNGKVQTTFQSEWSSVDTRLFAAPTAGSVTLTRTPAVTGPITNVAVTFPSQGSILGNNGAGPAKLAPYAFDSFMRLYFGADAMATNGLRYGAAIELRQNFSGQISNNASSGASGYSSLETVFVRRAFTYFAGEQWGIVRFGQADGVIGIFDNGVTTNQFLINGFNGGDNQNVPGGAIPFFFLAQAGNEYANAKFVYLSPQIAGFDFGFQYAPNTSNGYGIGGGNYALTASTTGAGTGTGIVCSTATTGCPTLSSGPGIRDGSRAMNQLVFGARYQGTLAGVGVLAYAAYEHSGHATYTGATDAVTLGNTPGTVFSGSRFNGQYDGLNFGSGGAALTFAGFTLGVNAIGGAVNEQLALRPKNGAPLVAYTVGLKYVTGPLTVGAVIEEGWDQGDVNLTGITQRRARGITAGGVYTVAPGFLVFAEYLWEDIQQNLHNFGPTAPNQSAISNNNVKSQGFLIGNVINF